MMTNVLCFKATADLVICVQYIPHILTSCTTSRGPLTKNIAAKTFSSTYLYAYTHWWDSNLALTVYLPLRLFLVKILKVFFLFAHSFVLWLVAVRSFDINLFAEILWLFQRLLLSLLHLQVAPPILLIVGVTTNALSCIIMTRLATKTLSTCINLAFLSICDILLLINRCGSIWVSACSTIQMCNVFLLGYSANIWVNVRLLLIPLARTISISGSLVTLVVGFLLGTVQGHKGPCLSSHPRAVRGTWWNFHYVIFLLRIGRVCYLYVH